MRQNSVVHLLKCNVYAFHTKVSLCSNISKYWMKYVYYPVRSV